MTPRKVIDYKNLPARLPVCGTLVLWLLLDRLHAPTWVWVECGIAWAVFVVIGVYAYARQTRVDIFDRPDVPK